LPGTVIKIDGQKFDPDPFANVVTIGSRPARVIEGDKTHLRVIALRNVATGPIKVEAKGKTATSAKNFRREGSTQRASPLQDSDSKLVTGQGFTVNTNYDMKAQGLNQKVLVVLAKPSDVDPEAF